MEAVAVSVLEGGESMSTTGETNGGKQPGSTFADRFFAPGPATTPVRLAAVSHVGKVRKNNEDHFIVVRRSRSREVLYTNLAANPGPFPTDYAYSLIVADGVGGAAFGEIASQLALETAMELVGHATSWVMKIVDLDALQMRARLDAYAERIQATMRAYIEAYPHLNGMATTWTSAYIVSNRAVVSHVGDSRAYLYRTGAVQQITRDDTLAQHLIDDGIPADAVQRFKHVLTDSFGGASEKVNIKIYPCELQPGDRLLLCTDGLHDMVDDAQLAQILAGQPDTQAACDALLARALDAGGKDNVTLILCDVIDESEGELCDTQTRPGNEAQGR
jgi:protein phosphatase